MHYSIGQFAEATGLSAHTLRYYEKEGLIEARRGRGGQRYYSEADLRWVEFIMRLKETGMPIRKIKTYADLRAEGEPTLAARLQMLQAHREHIMAELSRWSEHLKKMDLKIEYYQEELQRLSAAGASGRKR
ncbi:MerR family transcriptional regulator [Deltaproteobacteria bacterium Smac51]|nr:MerR family transcriptional regulator [Deltaproteobacteria bacterium Smac51]